MEPVNTFLVEELGAAYAKIEKLQDEVAQMKVDALLADSIRLRISLENDQLHDDVDEMREEYQAMERQAYATGAYAKWLEPKIALKRNHGKLAIRVPKDVLRHHYLSNKGKIAMVKRSDMRVVYWSEDFINWKEQVDVTNE